MGTTTDRFLNSILVFGLLFIGFAVTSSAFGQEPPAPPPGGPMMNPWAGNGPMMPGMPAQGMMQGRRGPGMMGEMPRQRMMPGMGGPARMQRMPGMWTGDPIAGLVRRPEIQKELGVTPEQLKKLEDIRFNTEKETIQHRAALQVQRLELGRLIGADAPDRAAIDKKVQEVAQEEAALMRISITARLDARSVLTPEQRTKLSQIMRERARPQRPSTEGPAQPRPRKTPAQKQ